MKKIIAISILSLLVSSIIIAQEYQKLIDENKIWYVLDVDECIYPCYRTFIYKFQQDTIINDMKYYTSYETTDSTLQSYRSINVYLREDTASQKVFLWDSFDGKDKLLYDFSLNTGDTIILDSNPINASQMELIVDKVDTIKIGSSNRKRIKLIKPDKKNISEEEYWIEGIGSSSGILRVGLNLALIHPEFQLLCVFQDNQHIYSIGEPCYMSTVGIEKNNQISGSLKIFPNPVINESVITYEEKGKNEDYILQVFDAQGNICFQNSFKKSLDYKVGNKDFAPGIYIATINNNKRILDMIKFIILN
jgi:hypothetical protein